MTKLKISKYFDIFTTCVALFLLFFCWFRFYTKNAVLSGILAVIFCFLGVFLIFFANFRHKAKKELSKKEQQLAEDCALQLQFSSQEKVDLFFEKILETKHKISKQPFGFVLKNENKNVFFVAHFSSPILTLQVFSKIFVKAKELSQNEIVVCANFFDDAVQTFSGGIKNFSIKLLNKFETFEKLIKPAGIFPEKTVDLSPEKLGFKTIVKQTLSKNKAKHYFLSGLVLFVCSFFVPYKLYYLIFGSLGFVLAITTLALAHKRPVVIKKE